MFKVLSFKYSHLLIFFFCFLFLICVLLFLYGASYYFILFLIFNMFLFFLPGFLLLNLLNFISLNFLCKLPVAFILGCSVSILFVFLMPSYFWIIPSLLACAEILYLIKNKYFQSFFICLSNPIPKDVLIASAISVLFTTVSLFSCVFYRSSFELVDTLSLMKDFVWHIGNINSLSKVLPPTDIHIANLTFKYHYFDDLLLSLFKRVINIDSFLLNMYFSPILYNFFLPFFFLGCLQCFKPLNSHYRNIALLLFFFIGECSFFYSFFHDSKMFFGNNFIPDMLSNINAITTSYLFSFAFFCIVFNLDGFKNNTLKQKISICLLLFIISFVLTGTKGPVAILIVFGFCLSLFISYLTKRLSLREIIPLLLSSSTAFIISYFIILSNTTASNQVAFSFGLSAFTFTPFASNLSNLGLLSSSPVYSLFMGLFTVFLMAPLQSIFFIKGFICKIQFLNKQLFSIIFIYVTVTSGFVLFVFYNGGRVTNLYYYYAILPLLAIITAEQLFSSKFNLQFKNFTFLLRTCSTILLLSLFLTTISSGVFQIYRGLLVAKSSFYTHTNVRAFNNFDMLTKKEFEGLTWLKNNSSFDDVFVSNRQYLDGYNSNPRPKYFYYTAFSERKCYLEGYDYVYTTSVGQKEFEQRLDIYTTIWSEDFENVHPSLLEDNVKYICFSKISPEKHFILPSVISDNYIKVFENSDIVIYDIS